MGQIDLLHTDVKYSPAYYPVAAVTDDTAQVSQIIDTQGALATELIMVTGTLTDANATFTLLIEDGDDSGLSDNAAVADSELLGDESAGNGSFTFAEDQTAIKIGYAGAKRYVRATVTPSGNTGDLYLAGVWAQKMRKQQTAQQV